MTRIRITILICGFGLAGFAGWFGSIEYLSFLQRSREPAVLFGPTATAPIQLAGARSVPSQLQQMTFCLNQQKTLKFLIAPQAIRQGFSTACLTRADQILAHSPSRSVAHLERADALWRLNETAEALDALGRAQATGAYEGWMAAVRARIALSIASGETPDSTGVATNVDTRTRALALAAKDIAVLADSPQIEDRLVPLYRNAPTLRDWFIGIMEMQSVRAQQRFLGNLKRAQEH